MCNESIYIYGFHFLKRVTKILNFFMIFTFFEIYLYVALTCLVKNKKITFQQHVCVSANISVHVNNLKNSLQF